MASGRPPVKYTYEEYCSLPEGARYQMIDGDIFVSPSPTRRHQTVSKRLFRALDGIVAPRKLGEVYFAPMDVILSDEDVVQPDIVYVSNARASLLAPEGIRGGPDLCVEVLSEGTQARDRKAKRVLYARHGVTEYWIVDPEANTLEVYRLQENPASPVRRLTASETLTTDLLPGFMLPLAELFAS